MNIPPITFELMPRKRGSLKKKIPLLKMYGPTVIRNECIDCLGGLTCVTAG